MTRFANGLRSLLADARGLTTVEYAIVLCLIAALGVAAWARFGRDLNQSIGRANVTIRDHLHVSSKGRQR
jgi:Flp pilus assembly pilin Flp